MARVALVLVLALAACGGGDARTPVRLQVFGDGVEVDAYRTLIDAFEAEHPTIRIELVPVPDQGDHLAKLTTGFAGGDPPDLFLANFRDVGRFAARDLLEPLGPHVPLDLFPQAMEAFSIGGRQLCMPQNVSSLVVYYNRALFREAGVPEPPDDWTWDGFLATAKALTNGDVYGVGTDPRLVRLAPFVWQAGGEVVDSLDDPTQITLLDDAAIEAMSWFIDLRREHRVSPTQAEAASEGYEERFAAGRLAMLLDSRRVTAFLRSVPDLDWDVAPLPRHRERATMLHSDAYCMPRATEVADEAVAFVRYALGPEGAPVLARTGRTVPSLPSVAHSDAFLDPTQPPARAQVFLDNIDIARRTPSIETWNEIEDRADVIVEEWYYGTEAPDALGIEVDLATRELFAEAADP